MAPPLKPDAKSAAAIRDPSAIVDEAKALLAQGRVQESEVLFRQVLTSPTHAAIGFYGIGLTRLVADDVQAAQSLFEQALTLDPANANALYQLGAIAEREGSIDEARSSYERVLALVPGHVGAQERLRTIRPQPAVSAPIPRENKFQSATPVPMARETHQGSAMYEFLRQDPSPLSRQTVAALDALEMKVHPKSAAYVGRHPIRLVLISALTLGLAAVVGYVRVRSITVTIEQGRLQISRGIFGRRLVNVDLWHVRGIQLERSFVNRLTGHGTLMLELAQQSGVNGNKPLELVGIARGQRLEDLYQQLLNAVFLLRSNPLVKGIIQ
jgi:hypothetical protein